MNPTKPLGSHPSLGAVIATFRKGHRLSVKQLAGRWGLPLERLRALEHDAVLPTADEVLQLADGLVQPPHRIGRHVRQTALTLLQEALHPHALTEQAAARHFPATPEVLHDTRLCLLPVLRTAMADALGVTRQDEVGFQLAWHELAAAPPARQAMVLEAAVVHLSLEGAAPEAPLFP